MWRQFDNKEKMIVGICENKIDAIHLITVFNNGNLNQSVQEFNIINYNAPSKFKYDCEIPPGSLKTKRTKNTSRLELTVVAIHPEDGNKFQLPRRFGYTENLRNKYWFTISNPDGGLDLFERWKFIEREINNIAQ